VEQAGNHIIGHRFTGYTDMTVWLALVGVAHQVYKASPRFWRDASQFGIAKPCPRIEGKGI